MEGLLSTIRSFLGQAGHRDGRDAPSSVREPWNWVVPEINNTLHARSDLLRRWEKRRTDPSELTNSRNFLHGPLFQPFEFHPSLRFIETSTNPFQLHQPKHGTEEQAEAG
jgi:hypothetical protein